MRRINHFCVLIGWTIDTIYRVTFSSRHGFSCDYVDCSCKAFIFHLMCTHETVYGQVDFLVILVLLLHNQNSLILRIKTKLPNITYTP